MKKLMNIIKKKWLIKGATTALLILALISIYILLNLWIKSLNITDIDFTQDKLYTLSDESKEKAKQVNVNVKLYFFGYDENASIFDLVKQYTKENEKITYELASVTQRVDLANMYGITSEDVVIIVQSDYRNKVVSSDELYTYDYTTYETIDISEETLTSAILDTAIEEKPTVYFLTGHEEVVPVMYIFTSFLQNEANNVSELDLLVKEAVPDDCDTLVIASPTNDFTQVETQKIINYINNGGNILFLTDPLNEQLTNINKIYELFGVSVGEGLVLETDSNKYIMNQPECIIPTVSSSHKITKDIYTDGTVCFIAPGKLDLVDEETLTSLGVTYEELVTASETAVYRKDFTNTYAKDEELEKGILGLSLEKTISEGVTSKMVIYSNSLFATEYKISTGDSYAYPINMYKNKDLVINSVDFLTEKENGITIRKDSGVVTYTATEMQDRIIKIIIFVIPVIIIGIGIIVWGKRRRKK